MIKHVDDTKHFGGVSAILDTTGAVAVGVIGNTHTSLACACNVLARILMVHEPGPKNESFGALFVSTLKEHCPAGGLDVLEEIQKNLSSTVVKPCKVFKFKK